MIVDADMYSWPNLRLQWNVSTLNLVTTTIPRWRKLEGSDPSAYEMVQKIQALQKRLISKTEEAVEKDMLIQVWWQPAAQHHQTAVHLQDTANFEHTHSHAHTHAQTHTRSLQKQDSQHLPL